MAMGVTIWISKLRPKPILLIDGDLHVRSVELKMCPVRDVTLADVLAGKKSWEDAVYACELESEGGVALPEAGGFARRRSLSPADEGR